MFQCTLRQTLRKSCFENTRLILIQVTKSTILTDFLLHFIQYVHNEVIVSQAITVDFKNMASPPKTVATPALLCSHRQVFPLLFLLYHLTDRLWGGWTTSYLHLLFGKYIFNILPTSNTCEIALEVTTVAIICIWANKNAFTSTLGKTLMPLDGSFLTTTDFCGRNVLKLKWKVDIVH